MNKLIKEWIQACDKVSEAYAEAERLYKIARRAEPPKNLRPAIAEDIKVGAIIWYPHWAENIDEDEDGNEIPGCTWALVEKLLYHGDQYKAYYAEDGCRYGLHGAFVEEAGFNEN